jgi:ABC-2 type transport system permease protein
MVVLIIALCTSRYLNLELSAMMQPRTNPDSVFHRSSPSASRALILYWSLQKLRAFLVRDFIVESSYQIAFAFELLQSMLPLFAFYFIAQLMPATGAGAVQKYGGYFPFVLVGVAFSQYLAQSLSAFAASIRRAQMSGSLEAMLSTRTGPLAIILFSPIHHFVFKTAHLIIVFLVGALALGARFDNCSYGVAGLAFALSVLAFAGLGMLSAALVVYLKKGDPVEWIMLTGVAFISGAYFPIELLPPWLQTLAWLSPLTHALEAMRMALSGATLASVGSHLLVLGIFAALAAPMGMAAFVSVVERGRRDGTLSHY